MFVPLKVTLLEGGRSVIKPIDILEGKTFLFNVGTPCGVHLFDHLL